MEINKETLSLPRNRLILCVGALIVAVLCITGNLTGRTFEREDMIPMTAVFEDCRYSATADITAVNTNDIYLLFNDGERLYIHSNCADDELTERLFALGAGARAEMLVDPETKNITELIIDGETWLSFETVQTKMNQLDVVLDWAGYAFFAVAGVLAVSLVPVLLKIIRKEDV